MSSVTIKTRVPNLSEKVLNSLQEELVKAADTGFEESQNQVAQKSVDTGFLLRSGVPPYVDKDGDIRWGYNAPYAAAVEFGSEPHWPPIQPLKGWARRVLGDENLAYAVQRKIAEKGTDPSPFVAPGVAKMRREIRRIRIDL